MEIIIRKAMKKDSNAIHNLIIELAIFEKEPDSVKVSALEIENHGFGSKPLFECIVAEINDVVVGMALYYPRYSTWRGPTFHLEDLIVSEKYKGKGIGTKLYSAFIRKSYNLGVQRVEWNVLNWNTQAVNFYKNSGATVLNDWDTVQMHRLEMGKYLDSLKES